MKKGVFIFLTFLAGAVIVVFLVLNLPFSQQFATRKINQVFRQSEIPVQIHHITKILPGSIEVMGFHIAGPSGDTVIGAGELSAGIRIFPLIKRRVILKEVRIHGVRVALLTNPVSGKFNIEEAFPTSGNDSSKESDKPDWSISVRDLEISGIQFRMEDPPAGLELFQQVDFIGLRRFRLLIGEQFIEARSLETRGGSGYLSLITDGSPSEDASSPPWGFELQDLRMRNMDFSFEDSAKNLMLGTRLKEVSMHARSLNWPAKSLDIRKLLLNGDVTYRPEPDSITNLPIRLSQIEVDLRNMELQGDQGRATLKNFQGVMEDGIAINQMSAELSATTGRTYLEVEADTDNSRLNLQGMTGSDLTALLNGSWDKDSIKVELEDCQVSVRDLSFFLPELDSVTFYPTLIQKPVQVEGRLKMSGTSIHVEHLALQQEKEFRIDLRGRIDQPRSFPQTGGEIQLLLDSRFGGVALSGIMDIPSDSVHMETSFREVTLGELLEIPGLGSFSGSGMVMGTGLWKDTLNSRFSFGFDTLTYLDYPYHQISITGTFRPGYLTGALTATDTFLQGEMRTEVRISDTSTTVFAAGDLAAKPEQLGFWKDTMAVESDLSAVVRIRPEGMETEWKVSNLNLTTPEQNTTIDSLSGSFASNLEKTGFSAQTGFLTFDGEIFAPMDSLSELLPRFQSYLTAITDSSGVRSKNRLTQIPGMRATGHVRYHSIVPFLLRDTGTHFSSLDFSLEHNTGRESLQARVSGNDVSFQAVKVKNLETSLTDSTGDLTLLVNAQNTSLLSGPEYHWELNARYEDRGPYALIRVSDLEEQVVYEADLHGVLDTGKIRLEIPSGQIILNRKAWLVDTTGILTINLVTNEFDPDLRIRSDSSIISLHSLRDAAPFTYQLGFQQLSPNALVREDLTTGMPSGRFTGQVDFSRIKQDTQYVETQLVLEKGSYAGLNFDRLSGNGSLELSGADHLNVRLDLDLDSASVEMTAGKSMEEGFQMAANLFQFPVQIVEPLLDQQVSEVKGHVSGGLHLRSTSNSLDYGGELHFEDAALRVNALNSRFTIPDQRLGFADSKIVFDRFQVLDSANRALTVQGFLDLEDLNAPIAELEISSSGIQLMNRSMDPGVPFTGNIFVDSRFSVNGPLSNPEIDGRILLANGTEIYYQLQEDLSLSESDQIVSFVSSSVAEPLPDTNMVPNHKNFLKSSVETMVDIDPGTSINFRVARRLYDLGLSIKGGGSVSYNLLDNNQVMLAGTYEIRQGDALLKLTGWPDKRFSISEGGFLRWDGAIEDPELRLEAKNQVRSSYINPVDGRAREVDVNVILQLSNRLSDLEVVFGIETPDQYIMSVINTLSPEEQMQQAVSILLFETIDLPGISSSTDIMTQQVNQLVASQINQLTSSAFKGIDISVGIDSYVQPVQGGGEAMKTNLTYQVRKSLLDNRAQFELSGRVNDFYQQPGASDVSLHDISFEYRLDSAATKYLKVYNKQSYDDVFEGEVMKTGIGFTYRKRYRSFFDIFRRTRKEKQP